jgi:phytoene synthase
MSVLGSNSSSTTPRHQASLDEAYERCRVETAQWAKTFYLGTLLMPPEKRRAIWAIYVWCRRTDEIMDSPQAYLDMIEGQRMDIRKHRYATFAELELYCYRVAGTVGLMSQAVMGLDPAYTSAPWSEKPDPSKAAIALGIANQLTNILRDVGEDRSRGRIYLPQDEMSQFGYDESDLLAGKVNENWRALMAFQLARAREWFARSEEGVRWLSADARWPVWASLRLYRGILDVIERQNFDVFNRRAFVPTAGKLLDLPLSYVLAQVH